MRPGPTGISRAPRVAVRLLVENQPNTSISTWADPAAPSEIRRITILPSAPGRTIAMLGTFWPAWKLTSDESPSGRALAEHPEVALVGRADDGDVDGDRQHVGTPRPPAGRPPWPSSWTSNAWPAPGMSGLGAGRRRVVDAAAGVEHALGRERVVLAAGAERAGRRGATGDRASVSAIDVTAEPMTRPNALTTRTQRRLIVTTGDNCNGSVISIDSGRRFDRHGPRSTTSPCEHRRDDQARRSDGERRRDRLALDHAHQSGVLVVVDRHRPRRSASPGCRRARRSAA